MSKYNKIYRKRWFYNGQLVLDTLIVIMSFYIGYRLHRPELFTSVFPRTLSFTLLYIGIIAIFVFGTLKTNECGTIDFAATMFYTMISIIVTVLIAGVFDFVVKGIGIWRQTIFWAILVQIVMLFISKFIIYKLHSSIVKPFNIIIVGTSKEELLKLLYIHNKNKTNTYIVEHLILEESPKMLETISRYKRVIVSRSCKSKETIIKHCAISEIDCMIMPSLSDIVINGGKFANMSDVMLLSMDIKMDLETRVIKRTFDIVISFIALVILIPVLIVIAILIKTQDGGKAIFTQKRVTRSNKVFVLYKFRTMIEDAEKQTGAVLAAANDERITKLGAFLRKYRLDETPQLYNVLAGHMSLIGPRPERRELIDKIVLETPEFKYRTLVKAGVTGLAQTMGKYNTDFQDKLIFDLYYINNYSLFLDIRIIFYTMLILFKPSASDGIDKNKDLVNILKSKGIAWNEDKDSIIIKK